MDQRKNTENGFNTVEEALEDLRQGKLILVTDDPDRENEGDFSVLLKIFDSDKFDIPFFRQFL